MKRLDLALSPIVNAELNWNSSLVGKLRYKKFSLQEIRLPSGSFVFAGCELTNYPLHPNTHTALHLWGQTHTSPSPSRGRQTQTQLRERTHRQENNIADTAGHVCLFHNKKIYLDICYCTLNFKLKVLYTSPHPETIQSTHSYTNTVLHPSEMVYLIN